jgi:transcriptional regulator with XRE-family HTH domain
MKESDLTFGKIILAARKKKGLILRECAALIIKEDNTPITFQYLNELENDRRTPSEHIIKQISSVLDIPVEYLYVYAEMFPKGIKKHGSQDKIVTAFKTFVKSISY